jgi:hypothetical protein
MIPGGQTKVTDIGVGRQLLCKEKPNTPATSACAKKVAATIKAAKRGLTPAQQALWQKYVYTSALLQAQRFCDKQPRIKRTTSGNNSKEGNFRLPSCEEDVLTGKTKFKGLFGKKFKWSDFLINGAKMIKKLPPKYDFGSGVPGRKGRNDLRDSNIYKGTNPNR